MTGTGILEELKETFKKGSMLTRLIYLNLGVYLAVKIVDIFLFLFSVESPNLLVKWLAVPASLNQLLFKPWTVFSYMFLHQDFLHILFNLLWLYWLGKIFLEYLTGKQLLNVYLLGGLSGAALFILAFNLFPAFNQSIEFSYALGASAGVLAIVIATATYVPNYTIYLMFLGPVKLKYIALASVALDIVTLDQSNPGGHIAHLGGAAFGFLYIKQLRKGKDISGGFGKTLDSISSWFKTKSNLKVTYKRGETDIDYNNRKKAEQKEIDKILEKIAKSGYESLSKNEKEILFKQSKNL
ncbi:MAG: rhomboid family intramembrane serine protease [Salinivirgaceae bacterium]|jgi:membrane associated rhomboid family serine protease|nr:rhomboid family intramembrane serine protease [Salinivirgaceae bacterium]